jgi:hypothetical protein
MLPDFDEWYLQRHGASFEDHYCQSSMRHDDALRELIRAVKAYTTEAARGFAVIDGTAKAE